MIPVEIGKVIVKNGESYTFSVGIVQGVLQYFWSKGDQKYEYEPSYRTPEKIIGDVLSDYFTPTGNDVIQGINPLHLINHLGGRYVWMARKTEDLFEFVQGAKMEDTVGKLIKSGYGYQPEENEKCGDLTFITEGNYSSDFIHYWKSSTGIKYEYIRRGRILRIQLVNKYKKISPRRYTVLNLY
jgi:hypothetical protein